MSTATAIPTRSCSTSSHPAPVLTSSTGDVEITDVDADGDSDVILVSFGLRLHENDGQGTFVEVPGALPSYSSVRHVDGGDVDGDGDPDLAVVSDFPRQLALNDGSGVYLDASSLLPPSPSLPNDDVVLVEADADGDLDIVIAHSNGLALYLNQGPTGFSDDSGRMPPDGHDATFLAAADVEGDGDDDLFAVYNFSQIPVRLLIARGRQLSWHALPAVGKTLQLDLEGLSGEYVALVGATGTAAFPTVFGTLHVDPASIEVGLFLTLDQQGLGTTSFPAIAASLLGLSFHWQALFTTSLRLSNLETTTFGDV